MRYIVAVAFIAFSLASCSEMMIGDARVNDEFMTFPEVILNQRLPLTGQLRDTAILRCMKFKL